MNTTGVSGLGQCGYCGMIHQGECPRVKAKEFHSDGSLKRVEFFGEATPSLFPPVLQPKPEEDADVNEMKQRALEHIRNRFPATDSNEASIRSLPWVIGPQVE